MKTRPKILVMDDDADVLHTARELLRQEYDVVTCKATFNRLSFIRDTQPDLVLMDVNMPLVPGDEVVRLLKDCPELCEIPVVLFSSNDERLLRRMARDCGAVGYIPKSALGGNFVSSVGRHLHRAEHIAPEI
jgi:CheY-like chemotaxis protein